MMTPEEACRIQIKLRLEQTDEIVQIPDHSELDAIKLYRQKLRKISNLSFQMT